MPHQPRVLVSQVIPASPEAVWEAIREFDALDEWNPGVSNCRMEEDRAPTEIGGVRRFEAGDRTLRERLVAHSDEDRFYRYTIVDGAGAKVDYLSELRLIPITETGETLAKQHAHFDLEDGDMDEEKAHLRKVYAGGFDELRDRFS